MKLKFKKPSLSPYVKTVIDEFKPNNFTKCAFVVAMKFMAFLYSVCLISLINDFINSPWFFVFYAFGNLGCVMFYIYHVRKTYLKYGENNGYVINNANKEPSVMFVAYPIIATAYLVLTYYLWIIKPNLYFAPMIFTLIIFSLFMFIFTLWTLMNYISKE